MRLAILGGTFDPIHNAHLAIARAAAERCSLDRVLFVPAAHPPHKNSSLGAGYEDRFEMVKLACQDDPRFEASRLEEGSGVSYSILTIEKVVAEDRQVFFIIGADAFAELGTWYRWQDVVRLVEFVVVTRPGTEYAIPPGARVCPLDGIDLQVSSSAIREELAAGRIPAELPPAVAEFIRERGLYGFGTADADSRSNS